jgi:hypothetical protein
VSRNLRELAATFIEKGEKEKGKGGFWSGILR